jgi:hypothetical protein
MFLVSTPDEFDGMQRIFEALAFESPHPATETSTGGRNLQSEPSKAQNSISRVVALP